MADGLKDFIKPPFANYDVVVYFGCGLFSFPLIFHYFNEPWGFRFPRFSFNLGLPLSETIISTLSLLFSVYILGHIIAYIASIVIEKSIDTFFGKVSSAIYISCWTDSETRRELVSSWIFDRLKSAFKKGSRLQNIIRVILHLPVIPIYLIIHFSVGFDYYKSRISPRTFDQIKIKSRSLNFDSVGLRRPWYKPIEHYVINNMPGATARMYNYLIIGGIFRSLALLFMACIWCEIGYYVAYIMTGSYNLKSLMYDGKWAYAHLFSSGILLIVYGFCVSSYMKFQRRYAEEALFAFVLCKDTPPTAPAAPAP